MLYFCVYSIAAGIPAATKGEGPIGTIVVVIFGFALAFYILKL